MTLRIAYTRPDGGLSIVNAAPKEQLDRLFDRPLTDDEYRAHVIERSIPADAVNVQELADAWTPPDVDRTFRNAWKMTGATASVDMAKAREVWREKMRRARGPLLKALDVETMKALEAGDQATMTLVAAKKQALRDITNDPAIEAAQTPAALKLIWPAVLTETPA